MDLNLIWKTVLSEIEIDLGKNNTRIHFGKSRLVSCEGGVVNVELATNLAKETVEKRYYNLLQNSLERQIKTKPSLVFSVAQSVATAGPLFEEGEKPQETVINVKPFRQEFDQKAELYKRTFLNPRYTFKTLVVGSSNNFAHAAAITIAKNPGQEYNPFFIYGGVGVGKTHLMQAIGNELFSKNPSLKILYTTAEHFMNDLVASLQDKSMPGFKRKYREIDVLLIDDIQFISKKEAMQDEFFHTFNSLFMQEKQIVLTSDRPPEEIEVEDRLLSRLMGGLAADVQNPDLEMRIAIIREKLSLKGESWENEVVEFLAAHFENNIREIEGAMQKISALSMAQNEPISLSLVKKSLGSQAAGEKQNAAVSPQKIIAATAKIFGIKQGDILSEKRDAEFVLPRQVIMYLLRNDCRIKLEEIARNLRRKDHTTVIHGVSKVEQELPQNPQLRQQILLIKREVWG